MIARCNMLNCTMLNVVKWKCCMYFFWPYLQHPTELLYILQQTPLLVYSLNTTFSPAELLA